ncbi:MAG: polyprenyl synthetase family protein [Ruminococcus sp.]|nr:polyprenyl synthetase family protein [Ruminococcus sp.]
MNTVHTEQMKADIALVEETLKELLPYGEDVQRQARVIDAMRYSLEAGGKRIRPVLVMEFCRLCGGSVQTAMAPAAALEMIHTFSLIHDDLPAMDDDDYRRGRKSCHKEFDEATAILAGDALSIHAFSVIAEDAALDAEQKVRLMQVLGETSGYKGMIGGQIIDMENEQRDDVDLDNLRAMCAGKTGALIRCACRMGCIAASASEETIALADRYGACVGLAFQIVDDILDVTSTTEVLGKPVGSDEASHKTTFVTLMGIEEAQKLAKALTDEAIGILAQFDGSEFLTALTQDLLVRVK